MEAQNILFVNACVRKDSRTERLARRLLAKLGGSYEELRLENLDFPKTDESYLCRRDQLIAAGDIEDEMFAQARQFAKAERIVIAAPYWDMSFPAALKQYIEHINVIGLTFAYTETGIPKGLCKAKKLYYVMTAGGPVVPEEFGFGYIRALAQKYYGIEDVELIKAVGLDIDGADPEMILAETLEKL